MVKCQCDQIGVLNPRFLSWYDPVTELPFVEHEPEKCACTNNLRQFVRKEKVIWLCSNCYTSTDEPVNQMAQVSGTVRAALAVLERWEIGDDLGATILGGGDAGYIAELRSGAESLKTRDAQDRTRLLLDIYVGLYSLLKNPKAEREWIRIPRADFGGTSLLDQMTEGSQLKLFAAKSFVDYVNGR